MDNERRLPASASARCVRPGGARNIPVSLATGRRAPDHCLSAAAPFGALAGWDGWVPSAGTDGNVLRPLHGQSSSFRWSPDGNALAYFVHVPTTMCGRQLCG